MIIVSPLPSSLEPKVSILQVTDETKSQIIVLALKDLHPSDHSVSDDGKLYLMLPESVFRRLPKKINGIPLVRVTPDDITPAFHKNYVIFENWAEDETLLVVTRMAHFWGGNTGGCRLPYKKIGGDWIQLAPECGATAS